MATTSTGQNDDGRGDRVGGGGTGGTGSPVGPPHLEAPTRQVVVTQAGETCVSCEAPLASDQRYCLNCGERRGRSRFPVTAPTTEAPQHQRQPAPRDENRRRTASGTALIAGIATLLLAMGVGVEIGRISNGNNNRTGTPARAGTPSVQVVTVGSGAAGTATTATPSSSAPATHTRAAKSVHAHAAAVSKVVVTKKVAAKATQAAAKALGASGKNLAPATVQVGQACSSGAGCQNGKFTGNFFGQ